MMETEAGRVPSEWRPVPGFRCRYLVSSDGRVRNASTGHILSGERDRDGYRRVNLSVDGRKAKRRVHRLVCEAFHGPQPEGCDVAHLDGSKANNRAENLAWATPAENHAHKRLHGTRQAGERNGRSKLSDEAVGKIREMRSRGMSVRAIAVLVEVGPTQIHRISAGEQRNG